VNDVRGFFGEFRFLSNFYPSPIEVNGKKYDTVEHFYQASKAASEEDHEYVRSSTSPGIAKHRGKRINAREDWNASRLHVMLDGLIAKFEQNQLLAEKLTDTDPGLLVEVNDWGDTFWGVCGNKGDNNLGKLLMFVRSTLHD
jgi:ribA/ribD-fused uncharacterized protein